MQVTTKDIKKGDRTTCSKDIFKIQLSVSGVKVTSATRLFFAIKQPWCVKNVFFAFDIFRFLYSCEIADFKICDVIRHCFIMEDTLMHILFES